MQNMSDVGDVQLILNKHNCYVIVDAEDYVNGMLSLYSQKPPNRAAIVFQGWKNTNT